MIKYEKSGQSVITNCRKPVVVNADTTLKKLILRAEENVPYSPNNDVKATIGTSVAIMNNTSFVSPSRKNLETSLELKSYSHKN